MHLVTVELLLVFPTTPLTGRVRVGLGIFLSVALKFSRTGGALAHA